MRNFLQLAANIETLPVLHQLTRNAHLWNENDMRQTYAGSPHAQADDIWLHFSDIVKVEGGHKARSTIVTKDGELVDVDEHECVPYRAWYALPAARAIALATMRLVDGVRLGRVVITRLKPGAKIFPHADGGSPATYYQRYQVALQSDPGVVFRAGDEHCEMRTGDVWWFNNRLEHEVVNNSGRDRIAMIVDIRDTAEWRA